MKVNGSLHNPTTLNPEEEPPLSTERKAKWARSQRRCFGKRKSLADARKKDNSTGPSMGFLLNYVIKFSNGV